MNSGEGGGDRDDPSGVNWSLDGMIFAETANYILYKRAGSQLNSNPKKHAGVKM
jgi:hypothetical protein